MLAFFDLLRLHSKHTREAVNAPRENISTEEAATEHPQGLQVTAMIQLIAVL